MIARVSFIAVLVAMLGCDRGPATPRRDRTPNHGLIGFIDAPAANSTVGPVFNVTGWAVGREGVAQVRIYLDADLMLTVPLTAPRPDIDRAYPRYAATGPLHGFGATIDAGSRAGYRTLRIEAIDRRGATAHVASASVKIEP